MGECAGVVPRNAADDAQWFGGRAGVGRSRA